MASRGTCAACDEYTLLCGACGLCEYCCECEEEEDSEDGGDSETDHG